MNLGKRLTVAQAADALDLNEDQLRREIAARRIRVLRRGRAVSIYERWLEEYIAANSVAPTRDARGTVPEESPSVMSDSLRVLTPRKRQIRVR